MCSIMYIVLHTTQLSNSNLAFFLYWKLCNSDDKHGRKIVVIDGSSEEEWKTFTLRHVNKNLCVAVAASILIQDYIIHVLNKAV